MIGVLIKRKFRHTDTQGRVPCEGEGRDRGDASKPRKVRDVPGNHQQLGERPGTDSLSRPQKEPTLPTH